MFLSEDNIIQKHIRCLIFLTVMMLVTATDRSGAYLIESFPQYGYSQENELVNSINNGGLYANIMKERISLVLALICFVGFLMQFSKSSYAVIRNVLDVVCSMAILVFTAPIMILVSVLIKIDSPGPVFYKQARVGLDRRKNRVRSSKTKERRHVDKLGHLFTIYKLRTMRCDAESGIGAVWASENDTRVTRLGKFLRKTHLDEFPQFINVLKGEMSIIGPRPERPEFVSMLNNNLYHYYMRYKIKPGITGLAQTRYHYTSSLTDTRNKLRYDLVYLQNMGLVMDMKIILSTFKTVVFGKGAR